MSQVLLKRKVSEDCGGVVGVMTGTGEEVERKWSGWRAS